MGFVSNASHLMGGQLTSRNIGGLTYEVTMTIYRDNRGIPVGNTEAINYDSAGTNIAIHNVPWIFDSTFYIGNNAERYTFIDTITFSAIGTYSMWFESSARNAAILNIPNPGSLHLNNVIYVDPSNSSPKFLNEPITVAQYNVPFNYNPLPFDVDGDSVSWKLDTPMGQSMTSALVPEPGYSLPSSDTLVPFALDAVTGEITFLPNLVGNFVVSVLVSEYRAGIKIGEIRRDMQIIVLQSTNKTAIISLNSLNAPFSGKNYTIAPGSGFNFTVIASDPDGNAIDFSANGEPFLLANNPATFNSTASSGSSIGTLSWTPSSNSARTQPYIIGLRVSEPFGINVFSNDISINVKVSNATGIHQQLNSAIKFNVYPNPTSDYIMLSFNSEKKNTGNIEVLNLAGQSVKEYSNLNVVNGLNVIRIDDLRLSKGNYVLTLKIEGEKAESSTINIQ